DQPQRNLSTESMRVKLVPREVEHEKGEHCHRRKHVIVPAKHAPGSSCITPMHQSKKTIQYRLLFAILQKLQHNQLCELVEREDAHGHNGDAPIGIGFHARKLFPIHYLCSGDQVVQASFVCPEGNDQETKSECHSIENGAKPSQQCAAKS